jgi:hypothetical protein
MLKGKDRNVKKWSLMSSKRVPDLKVCLKDLHNIWSIKEYESSIILVALEISCRYPLLCRVVM